LVRCAELRDVANSPKWEWQGLAHFLEGLDSLPGRLIPEKTSEFLKVIQDKDREKVLKLQIMGKEMEFNAREKDLFIQKLKGVVPFLACCLNDLCVACLGGLLVVLPLGSFVTSSFSVSALFVVGVGDGVPASAGCVQCEVGYIRRCVKVELEHVLWPSIDKISGGVLCGSAGLCFSTSSRQLYLAVVGSSGKEGERCRCRWICDESLEVVSILPVGWSGLWVVVYTMVVVVFCSCFLAAFSTRNVVPVLVFVDTCDGRLAGSSNGNLRMQSGGVT
nr:hypothetical protein [Tanacetum cinerariifolium]